MKKLLIVLLLLLTVGCTKNDLPPAKITADNPQITPSLKAFYDLPTATYVCGEHFQIKMLPIYSVKFADPAYDTAYTEYRYQVLIAPLLDEAILLQDVITEPSESLKAYFAQDAPGRASFADMAQMHFDEVHYPQKEGVADLIAYRFDFYVSNLGDVTQTAAAISDEAFDEGMKTLTFHIKFNNQAETITVTSAEPIIKVKTKEEVTALNRADLLELYEKGGTNSFFAPYQNEFIFE